MFQFKAIAPPPVAGHHRKESGTDLLAAPLRYFHVLMRSLLKAEQVPKEAVKPPRSGCAAWLDTYPSCLKCHAEFQEISRSVVCCVNTVWSKLKSSDTNDALEVSVPRGPVNS